MRLRSARATIMFMSPRTPVSLLLLLPEDTATGLAQTERPKIRRYRLVRMRFDPPWPGDCARHRTVRKRAIDS